MVNQNLTPYKLFRKSFTLKYLRKIFESKIQSQKSRGIDRINASQFRIDNKRFQKQLKIIKYKCVESSYNFSPYVEILKSKGRNKYPRIIAVPTVRDRIVLYALKEILSTVFEDCVRRKLANTYIHDIQKATQNISPSNLEIFGTDIKNFYGSISRKILLKKLSTRIKSKKILTLVEKSISTPIVPRNYRKDQIHKYYPDKEKGLPQGLSISNILADIYVSEDIDQYIKDNYSCNYFRYVDDIIIFSNKENSEKIKNTILAKFSLLELNYNEVKTFDVTGKKPFEYLGYRFELPRITVKQSSIDKFINSIAAKFSDYLHNGKQKLKNFSYLTKDRAKEIFIIELNEKITGAISENKRYGWIFYFNAINDLSILYRLDHIISNFFTRLEDFSRTPPENLKKLSRAYYEVKHYRKMNNGYIHNYNIYQNTQSKLMFLEKRGHTDPKKNHSDLEINRLFSKIKSRNLSQLEKDDANIY